MIAIQGLSKRFTQGKGEKARTVQAVADVKFTAPDRSILGLLGANGAGKTSTLRMIAGLIAADQGSIEVDHIDVRNAPQKALARLGILSDARGLYPRLTARENIVYYGALHSMHPEAANARAEALADMFDLRTLLDRRTDGFSQGERMKTALARALVHDPANIILDEPTNGLDVLATRALRESLRNLRDSGKCIIFSTHIMQEVERLCDDVTIIAHGRTVAQGTVAALLDQAQERDFEEAFVKVAFDSSQRCGQSAPQVQP